MNLYIDTPKEGNLGRGIGTYTTNLSLALSKLGVKLTIPEAADVLWYPGFAFFDKQLPLFARAPLVVTIHDCIPLDYRQNHPVGIRGNLAFAYQKLALSQAAAIVTDSKASATSIAKWFPRLPAADVIPLGVELSPPSAKQVARFRSKMSLPASFIGYVGDINFNKNLVSLVEAAANLKLPLVIVTRSDRSTPTPEAVALWYAQKFSGADVRFITIDSRSDLACFYNSASVMVTPSYAEGFGLPLLEAMASGGVVVAPKLSSLPEVGGEACIYANSAEVADLQKAIQKAVSMSAKSRQAQVEAGIARARLFSWERSAEQLFEVFTRVIK